MADAYQRPTFAAAVLYKNPFAALDWLEKAFGFERSMVITDASGNLGHAEMKFGDGYIMVGGEWADFVASPATVAGKNTQTVHVHLNSNVDAHCERARAAGAAVLDPHGAALPDYGRAERWYSDGVVATPRRVQSCVCQARRVRA